MINENYSGLRTLNDAFSDKGKEFGNTIVQGYKQLMLSGATADDLRLYATATGYAPIRVDEFGASQDLTDYFSQRAPRGFLEGAQDFGVGIAKSVAGGTAELLPSLAGAAKDIVGIGGEESYRTAERWRQAAEAYTPSYSNEYRISRESRQRSAFGDLKPQEGGQAFGSTLQFATTGGTYGLAKGGVKLTAKAFAKTAAGASTASRAAKIASRLPAGLRTASNAISRGAGFAAGSTGVQAASLQMAGSAGKQAYDYQMAQAEESGQPYDPEQARKERRLPIAMGLVSGQFERTTDALIGKLAPGLAGKLTSPVPGKRMPLPKAKDLPGFLKTGAMEIGKEYLGEEGEALAESIGQSSYMKDGSTVLGRFAEAQAGLFNTVPLATSPLAGMAAFKAKATKNRLSELEKVFNGEKSFFRIGDRSMQPMEQQTVTYADMTPEQQAEMQQELMDTGVAWDLTTASTEALDEAAKNLASTGVRVVFVKPSENAADISKASGVAEDKITTGQSNGHVGWYDEKSRTVYVNAGVSPEMQFAVVKSHEVVHDLRRSFRGDVDALRQYFIDTFGDDYLKFEDQNFGPKSAYAAQMRKDNPKFSVDQVTDLLTEEALTNFMTNRMSGYLATSLMSDADMTKLYERSPGIFADMVDVITSWGNQMLKRGTASPFQEQIISRLFDSAKAFEAQFSQEVNRKVGGATESGKEGVAKAMGAVTKFNETISDLLDRRRDLVSKASYRLDMGWSEEDVEQTLTDETGSKGLAQDVMKRVQLMRSAATAEPDTTTTEGATETTTTTPEPKPAPEGAKDTSGFKIPAASRASQQKYGDNNVDFESDFDRAAYIVATEGSGKKATPLATKLKAQLKAEGYSLNDVVKHGNAVRADVKAQAKGKNKQRIVVGATPFVPVPQKPKGGAAPAAAPTTTPTVTPTPAAEAAPTTATEAPAPAPAPVEAAKPEEAKQETVELGGEAADEETATPPANKDVSMPEATPEQKTKAIELRETIDGLTAMLAPEAAELRSALAMTSPELEGKSDADIIEVLRGQIAQLQSDLDDIPGSAKLRAFIPNDEASVNETLGSVPGFKQIVDAMKKRVAKEMKPGKAMAGAIGYKGTKERRRVVTDVLDVNVQADYEQLLNSKAGLKVVPKLVDIVKKSDDFRFIDRTELEGKSDREVLEIAIERMADNLEDLYLLMDPQAREAAKLWYRGANIIANSWSKRYGIPLEKTAAVLAVFSPQKDWDQNISLAERMLDIYFNMDRAIVDDQVASDGFDVKIAEIRDVIDTIKGREDSYRKKLSKAAPEGRAKIIKTRKATRVKDEKKINAALKTIRKLERVRDSARGKSIGDLIRDYTDLTNPSPEFIEQAKGWTVDQMEKHARKIIAASEAVRYSVKAFDEAKNDRSYARARPDGMLYDPTGDSVAWGGTNIVEKSLKILSAEENDLETVSIQLGSQNKVRSFFSDIADPTNELTVTVDTHAIAAALLQVLSGNDAIVKKTLTKSPGSAALGTSGLYALIREAYIRAAKRHGVLPKQMQSIVWEQIRSLFDLPKGTRYGASKSEATASKRAITEAIDRAAIIGREQAFAAIREAAGGARLPEWVLASTQPTTSFYSAGRTATYSGPLVGEGLSKFEPQGEVERGAGGRGDRGGAKLRAFVPNEDADFFTKLPEELKPSNKGLQDALEPWLVENPQLLEQFEDPDIKMSNVDPEIDAFLEGSVFTTTDGKPMPLVHSTAFNRAKYSAGKSKTPDAGVANFGAYAHLGTPTAAMDRTAVPVSYSGIADGVSLDTRELSSYERMNVREDADRAFKLTHHIKNQFKAVMDAAIVLNRVTKRYDKALDKTKGLSRAEGVSEFPELERASLAMVSAREKYRAQIAEYLNARAELRYIAERNSKYFAVTETSRPRLVYFRGSSTASTIDYPMLVASKSPIVTTDSVANILDPKSHLQVSFSYDKHAKDVAAVFGNILEKYRATALESKINDAFSLLKSISIVEAFDLEKDQFGGITAQELDTDEVFEKRIVYEFDGQPRSFELTTDLKSYETVTPMAMEFMMSWANAKDIIKFYELSMPEVYDAVVAEGYDPNTGGPLEWAKAFTGFAAKVYSDPQSAEPDMVKGKGMVKKAMNGYHEFAAGHALLSSGIDGVMYINEVEDAKSLSFMSLSADTIRPALATGPDPMAQPAKLRAYFPDPRPWFSSGRDKNNPLDFSQMDDPSMGFFIKKLGDKLMAPRNVQKAIEAAKAAGVPNPVTGRLTRFRETMDFSARADMHKAQLAKMLQYSDEIISRIQKALADGDIALTSKSTPPSGTATPGIPSAEEYLYAKHAKQRNAVLLVDDLMADDVYTAALAAGNTAGAAARAAQMIARNPNLMSQSGMTNAQADDILQRAAASGKQKHYDEISAASRELQSRKLKLAVQYGLLSEDAADDWQKKYGPDYIPLKTTKNDPSETAFGGSSFSIKGRESERAKGRTSLADDLLGFAIVDYGAVASRAVRNRVGQSFLMLLKANPNPSWEFYKNRAAVPVKDLERVITAKFKGKEVHVVIRNAEIVKALRDMDSQGLSTFTAWTASLTRLYTRLNTQYSPAFIPTNFLRDAGLGLFFTWVDRGPETLKQMAKFMPSATRTCFQMAFGRKPTNPQMAKFYNEMDNEGGFTEYAQYQSVDTAMAELQLEMDILFGRTRPGTALRAVKNITPEVAKRLALKIGKLLVGFGQVSERSVRLASYAAARTKNGMSPLKSAEEAKNLTINFERGGTVTPTANTLYTFFNARMQSVLNINRRMPWSADRTPEQNKRMVGGLTAMMAFGYMAHYIARMGAGDDDEGENQMQNVPKHELQGNIVMPTGIKGTRANVPLPYGLNVMYYAGVQLDRMIAGYETPSEAMGNLMDMALTNISPIDGASWAQFVSPTFADPAVQVVENADFRGQKIYPDQNPYDRTPVPDSQLAFKTVNPALKAAAEYLNELTGGSERESGGIDVSPESIEHVMRFAAGGAGDFLFSSVDGFMKLFGEGPSTVREVPLVGPIAGRFIRQTPASNRTMSEFYENIQKMAKWRDDFEDPKTTKEARSSRLRSLDGLTTDTEKKIRELRKLAKASPTPEREKVYNERMLQEMQRYNLRFNRLTQQPSKP